MIQSIDDKVIIKIKKAKGGSLFFIDDFLSFGSAKAVSKALERLVERKELDRVDRGIYSLLAKDKILGPLKPSAEEIEGGIRRRDKSRIIPTGNFALNVLGLSTQIPINVVYCTDGSARKIDLGSRTIVFKKTSAKKLATIGKNKHFFKQMNWNSDYFEQFITEIKDTRILLYSIVYFLYYKKSRY
jgi:hypothetical protein